MSKKVTGAVIGGLIGVLVIPVFFGGFIYFVGERNPLPILAALAVQPIFLIIGANPGRGKGDGTGGGGFFDGGSDGGGGDGGGGG